VTAEYLEVEQGLREADGRVGTPRAHGARGGTDRPAAILRYGIQSESQT
jgi:hypothetical protein